MKNKNIPHWRSSSKIL